MFFGHAIAETGPATYRHIVSEYNKNYNGGRPIEGLIVAGLEQSLIQNGVKTNNQPF